MIYDSLIEWDSVEDAELSCQCLTNNQNSLFQNNNNK